MVGGIKVTVMNEAYIEETFELYKEGKLALPAFQRPWVWTAHRVHNLIDSLIHGYPIGSITTVKAGPNLEKLGHKEFLKGKPFEVNNPELNYRDGVEGVELVLDGQQRLTSLLQILTFDSVFALKTENTEDVEKVRFYLDIKALRDSKDDIILTFSEPDRKDKLIYKPDNYGGGPRNKNITIPLEKDEEKEKKEFEELLIPIKTVLFFDDEAKGWAKAYCKHLEDQEGFSKDDARDKADDTKSEVADANKKLNNSKILRIVLDKKIGIKQISSIYRNMNTNAVMLTIFDLLTAIYAGKCNLSEIWNKIVEKNSLTQENQSVDTPIEPPSKLDKLVSGFYRKKKQHDPKMAFLRMTTLCYKEKNHKEKLEKDEEILDLPYENFNSWKETIQQGIRYAYNFLDEEKLEDTETIGVPPNLFMTLAALSSYLISEKLISNDKEKQEDTEAKEKLKKWFWRAALRRESGGALNKAGMDFRKVCDWIFRNEDEVLKELTVGLYLRNIKIADNNRKSRELKVILHLLRKDGGGKESFGNEFSGEELEVHHIFPKSWCDSRRIEQEHYNSVANLVEVPESIHKPLSSNSPKYLFQTLVDPESVGPKWKDIKKIEEEKVKDIFKKNKMNKELLAENDFKNFIEDREKKLTKLVEQAVGMKLPKWDPDTKTD